ncbi:hypothetical protein WH50_12040 [Pokkaliibacter plantistimulans]|uniref:Peptidase M48 domain-containing protein n=1 Tax=Pokkaliibacter plantistimulans TaxID=1635171 RepID=A0ABX5LXL4_9GAMM|nr:M48 family metallopeptidase [Pokkaliibacter plantistimulans]PXF31036.1 hypothetical protein WH50_12040 [Pokkaliibacter plantistimulans]
MTQDEFERRVTALEKQAQANPTSYKLRVFLLALAGNAYLLAILALLLVMTLAVALSVAKLHLIGVKLLIIVVPLLWLTLKAMYIKVPRPQGMEISAADAPELFAMIDSIRTALRAPRFDHVLVTDDLNAAVVQSPRLGIFGWYRNYLILGLPLMHTLTPEQFKAVLAHEYGHLSGGHGRLGNWLYRLRLRWSQLLSQLEGVEGWVTYLFKPFLSWFIPRFNAYSFPLARANEYEADAVAARLTSPAALAQALTGVQVANSYMRERFWPDIHRQAEHTACPAAQPFSEFGLSIRQQLTSDYEGWIADNLRQQTTFDDTHPSLQDRLQAFQATAQWIPPASGNSALELLGAMKQPLLDHFDQQWSADVAEHWKERFETVQEARQQLATLNQRVSDGETLSPQELYDRAQLTAHYENDLASATAQLRALNEQLPDDLQVAFALAQLLLRNTEEQGVELMHEVINKDPEFMIGGYRQLAQYFWQLGQHEVAADLYDKVRQREHDEYFAHKERNQLHVSSTFLPHELGEASIADLQQRLRKIEGLTNAFLVRKKVYFFPERPCFVLGYKVATKFGLFDKKLALSVLQHLQVMDFPGEAILINVEGDNKAFAKQLKKVAGSRLI